MGELDILGRIRQAVEDGDSFAQFELGLAFDWGAQVEQDFQKAAALYAKAAEQGHRAAEHNLLLQHVLGQAKIYRPAAVFEKLTAQARTGDRDAQNNLGLCFKLGYGTLQDYVQAAVWFRRAARSGSAAAQFNVGGLYFEGTGVKKNLSRAAEWYRRAAEQRDELALLQLGHIYQKGLGVEINLKRAFLLYLIAYKQGSSRAANHLGFMFKKGLGINQDDSLAFELYLESINSPDTHQTVEKISYHKTAYYWLGHMTEKGEGTKRNRRAAMRWYARGTALGESGCVAALARLRSPGQTSRAKICSLTFTRQPRRQKTIRCHNTKGPIHF